MIRSMVPLALLVLCVCQHSATAAAEIAAAAASAHGGLVHSRSGPSWRRQLLAKPESYWSVAPGTHIKMQDPSPEQAKQCSSDPTQPYCKVCKSVAEVAALCSTFEWCHAFVLDTADGCSYLKASGEDLSSSSQFVTFCWYEHEECQDSRFEYNFYPNADLQGVGDFSCPGSPDQGFCRTSGDINAAASACATSTPACNSFVIKAGTGGKPAEGFLKTAAAPLSGATGIDVYVRASADSPEARPGRDTNGGGSSSSNSSSGGSQDGKNAQEGGSGPTATPSDSAVAKSQTPKKKLPLGAVIGIAVGGAVLAALLVLGCCWFVKRRRQGAAAAAGEKSSRTLPTYSTTMDSQLGLEDYSSVKYADNVAPTARVG